tara:strand:- start:2331 stop:2540 length:210 start_codon:yes stop_codon:yes gene_type:complete
MNNADRPVMPVPRLQYSTDMSGLTKREHFAGLAMQGLVAQSYIPRSVKELAFESLAMADALLKALDGDV